MAIDDACDRTWFSNESFSWWLPRRDWDRLLVAAARFGWSAPGGRRVGEDAARDLARVLLAAARESRERSVPGPDDPPSELDATDRGLLMAFTAFAQAGPFEIHPDRPSARA